MPEISTAEQLPDWDWVVARLAEMAPRFEPRTTNAYHAASWGWLMGELIRRRDPEGRDVYQVIREDLLEPLAITDGCFLPLPPGADDRLARLSGTLAIAGRDRTVMTEAESGPHMWRAGSPAGGAVMTATAGARFFAMLANGGQIDGVRLVSEKLLERSLMPRDDALVPDAIAGRVRLVGAGAYWLGGRTEGAEPLVARGTRVLWHPGAGGSVGWADLDQRIGVAICHNRLFDWEGLPVANHPFGPIVEVVERIAG
jgi:CubicO group peptidase (beta-lactamase class C family)